MAIAAGFDAGSIRESPCENAMFLRGAAKIPKTIRAKRTTATGRFITIRAVCAQRPSSFGVIADLRITPLSTLGPTKARIGGRPKSAPATASATTDVPAYPNDLRNGSGKKVSESRVTKTVRPE